MIKDNQSSLTDYLMQLSRGQRFTVAILGSALLSCYLPFGLIALTGIWRNNLFASQNLLIVAILSILSLVGYRFRSYWWSNLVPAAGMAIFTFYGMATTRPLADWPLWWEIYFFIIGAALLNAYLMSELTKRLDLRVA